VSIDPYTGVRTRENIVAVGDDDLEVRVTHLQTAVAGYNAGTRDRSFEQNLVPAEDLPAHETVAQLRQLIADMEHDWKTLNGFFNKTAQTRDWCSEYEERLQNYNQSFKVLRMVGRPRNWVGSTCVWKSVDGNE